MPHWIRESDQKLDEWSSVAGYKTSASALFRSLLVEYVQDALRWMNINMKPFTFLLPVAVILAGCHTQLIPNTDVEDNEHNRAVVEFCEKYRRAVELRDVRLLLKLAHKDYYEDGGNVDPSDDLDRAGLGEYLQGRFRDAQAIRYEIRYRRVGEGRKDGIFVDYTFSASYQIASNEGDVWRRAVADNRLELVPEGESFLIKSGM